MSSNTLLTGKELGQALFNPRSIALIGTSDDPKKTGGRPLHFLRNAGFTGTIYPINPRREQVQGEQSWPSIDALPEVPEHAYILTPTEHVIDAVLQCAKAGVKVVTILAAGFSESGPEGAKKEEQLKKIANETGIRIVGPSSLGIVSLENNLLLTANGAFAEPDLPKGQVMVASHSGSMIGALLSRGKAFGMGFHTMISVGSEADLTLGEICASTLTNPEIKGYLLFLESLHGAEELRDFALQAYKYNKPVYAYKLGRSQAAAEMTVTHTGALAGQDDIAEAFLQDAGIFRVDLLETLFQIFPLLDQAKGMSQKEKVGVITTTGGGAAMLVDQLGIRSITVESATDETQSQLKDAGIPGSAERVIDLTLAGTNYEVMSKTLELLQHRPEYDLLAVVIGSSARFQPELAVKPIIDIAATLKKPLVCMLVPDAPEAYQQLMAANIPCFTTPETCADAIAAVFKQKQPRALSRTHYADQSQLSTLDEGQAYDIMREIGIAHAPFVSTSLTSATDKLEVKFPVVAKVCSTDIQHKSDIGGVILGINNRKELDNAIEQIHRNLLAHGFESKDKKILIQDQSTGLAEVLLGFQMDPQVGPIVLLAAGGIWAEVLRDRSVRMAPVTKDIAWEMIHEVKMLQMVSGLRGMPEGDLDALADAIVKLSTLAHRDDLRIHEAEVNPLLIQGAGKGVLAVDALAVQYGHS